MTVAAATSDTLSIAEAFGATFQGEGPSTGRRASFIRLGGCNLSCKWCDTPYTWDAKRFDLRKEITRRPVAELIGEVDRQDTGLAVITGGEPLLQQSQPAWAALLSGLDRIGVDVEVETNGTIKPADMFVSRFNVSPKLAHSGDPIARRIVPAALVEFAYLAHAGTACFKFVVKAAADLDQVDRLVAEYEIPRRAVWIMPEGTSRSRLIVAASRLADPVIDRGYNLSTRLHVLLWGNERSR